MTINYSHVIVAIHLAQSWRMPGETITFEAPAVVPFIPTITHTYTHIYICCVYLYIYKIACRNDVNIKANPNPKT